MTIRQTFAQIAAMHEPCDANTPDHHFAGCALLANAVKQFEAAGTIDNEIPSPKQPELPIVTPA